MRCEQDSKSCTMRESRVPIGSSGSACYTAAFDAQIRARVHRRSRMKHIAWSVLGILALSTALSTNAFAQAPADAATAVLALPAAMRDDATVIKWKPDFTY